MWAPEQRLVEQYRKDADESRTFGASLYALRIAAAKTQAEVAAIAGISNSYYCGIENGKRLPPPRRTAARLARAVGLSGREADALVAMAESYSAGQTARTKTCQRTCAC